MLWLLLGLGAGVLASVLVFNWRERRQLKALTPARRESAADQRLEQEESHEDIDDRWEWGVEMVMRRSTLLDDRQCPARMGNKPSRLVITGNQTATLAVLLATRQGGLTVDDHQAVGDQASQWEASGAIRLPASAVPPLSDLVRRARQAQADIAEVAIADDQTRRFVQERFKIGTEDERRLGMAAALNSFPMLSHDEKGSSVLQGTGIL